MSRMEAHGDSHAATTGSTNRRGGADSTGRGDHRPLRQGELRGSRRCAFIDQDDALRHRRRDGAAARCTRQSERCSAPPSRKRSYTSTRLRRVGDQEDGAPNVDAHSSMGRRAHSSSSGRRAHFSSSPLRAREVERSERERRAPASGELIPCKGISA